MFIVGTLTDLKGVFYNTPFVPLIANSLNLIINSFLIDHT